MLGNAHATRLKPDFGGSAYTFVPNSWTNACKICSSVSPLAMCWSTSFSIALAVSHGPENAPPGCEQIPAAMSHPRHMHLIFMPTCFARSESCCAPSGAISSGAIADIASSAIAAIGRVLLMAFSQCNRRGKPMRHWLCRWLLGGREHQHRTAIRQHSHERSAYHHHSAEPDPLHQLIQIGVDHRQLRIRARSRVHYVQIFLQRRTDRHHRAVLLGGRETPFLRIKHHRRLVVLEHFDEQSLRGVILFRFGVEAL